MNRLKRSLSSGVKRFHNKGKKRIVPTEIRPGSPARVFEVVAYFVLYKCGST